MSAASLTPERWQEVKAALAKALELSGAARFAYLARLEAADPHLRGEVDSLLGADAAAGSRFLDAPAAAADPPAVRNRFAGRRAGPYRLVEEIGAGGMGEVYRAVRADEAYELEVAVKLVRAGVGVDAAFVGERLRAERQILASFEHPNIARLLDGGTTEDGVPFLVMELIAGKPITEYCDAKRLDTSARLELFLKVCSAVQYAHQRMVIHRDLKPSNVLVTEQGVPKLLDFGIATILEPHATPVRTDVTTNTLRVLTPQYASPEQLKGEAVTTGSDAYSLGVILYELLTGVRPFAGRDRITGDVLEAVLDRQPKKPSSVLRRSAPAVRLCDEQSAPNPFKLRRRLRGDLDNIVLMALRNEPQRRYATVEQLASDIRRHLEHLPVSARAPTLGYHAATFVRRHRLGAAATALIAAALVGGIITTLREAHVAELERARAERRFTDLRRLANALIFEIHDSIRDLPGAEQSRELLIRTALAYLDGLSREAAGDAGLLADLASAYIRLGDLEGRAREANEGNLAGAWRSYQRAYALQAASIASGGRKAPARLDIVVTCGKLSDLAWVMNDATRALSYSLETVTRSRALAHEAPADHRRARLLAMSLTDYGYKLYAIRGSATPALADLEGSIGELESLAAADPKDTRAARTLSLAFSRKGEILAAEGDYAQALAADESSRGVIKDLARAAPRNADFAHLEAFSDQDIAARLTDLKRLDEATQHERAALAVFESLTNSDPQVAEYHLDVGLTLLGTARIAARRSQPERALPLLGEALEALAQARGRTEGDAQLGIATASAESLLGQEHAALAVAPHRSRGERLKDWRSARDAYARALAIFQGLSSAWFQAARETRRIPSEIARCEGALATAGAGPTAK